MVDKIIIKKNIKTSLGKRGYAIIKSKHSYKEIQTCKKDLTVKAFVNQDYGGVSLPFSIYLESPNKLYLPKFYGLEKFGIPDDIKIKKGKDIDLHFNGKLRDKQIPVIDKFMNTCSDTILPNKTNGGIIAVGCGFGKTIMALYLLTKLNRKTIIIVHKEFLLNQWNERIKEFIPNAKVGKIQGSIIDIDDKDVVIGMLQSISMKEYEETVFKEFGFVIIDECHHIGAEVFSRALPKVNCYYSLGLSATPNRADGLSKVFNMYLGPIIYKAKDLDNKIVNVNIINYIDYNKDYTKEEISNYGKICVPKMINNISNNIKRNQLIIYLAKNLVELKKQVIILSDRRDQLSYFFGEIKKFTSVGYYIGGMKQKDLDASESANVILGTFPMSSEGLDIPTLDAAIFATPKSSIEQSIGRITRKKHISLPIAYDIVDCFSIFPNQLKKREKVYKKLKYNIKYGDFNGNNNISESSVIYFIDNVLKYKDNKPKNNVCLIEED